MLAQKPVIRQFLAAALLLIFSFSIAPKKFLHDAIANHKDKVTLVAAGENAQLSHEGFICKCDNLVAESPFTDDTQSIEIAAPQFFAALQSATHYHFYSSTVFFFELRGPPAHQV